MPDHHHAQPFSTAPGARALASIAVAASLIALLGACTLVPTVGSRTWGLAVTNDTGANATITVNDASGLVKEVEFDPADADLFGGVTAPAGKANTLDVTWTAGACDTATAIDIKGRGQGLAITVGITSGAGCDAFGTPRAIRLTLAAPIAPAAVTVTQ